MTRVTAPISKLCRGLSSSAAAPRLLSTAAKASSPQIARQALEARNLEPHQPRAFHPSPAPPAQHDSSALDFAVLPSAASLFAPAPVRSMRMPLLPDNYKTHHAPDTPDAPLPTPAINVIAAGPETVAPAALTEVEGMGVDGVELRFAHEGGYHHGRAAAEGGRRGGGGGGGAADGGEQQGMLRDLWKGLVDDVLGNQGQQQQKLAV